MRDLAGGVRAVVGICALMAMAGCQSSGAAGSGGGSSHLSPDRRWDFGPVVDRVPREAIEVVLPEGEIATVSVSLTADIRPLVYAVAADSGGEAVADAIVNMLTTSELAVSVSAEDDEWGFVGESPTLDSVHPGEEVTLELELTGTMPAADEETRYELTIELVGHDGTRFDAQPVVVVVPAA